MAGVRDTYIRDYYISKEDEKKVLARCRNARGYEQVKLLHACISANPDIAQFIFINLTTGIGFDNMCKKEWIPMQRKDFQGYRRLAVYNFYDWLRMERKL